MSTIASKHVYCLTHDHHSMICPSLHPWVGDGDPSVGSHVVGLKTVLWSTHTAISSWYHNHRVWKISQRDKRPVSEEYFSIWWEFCWNFVRCLNIQQSDLDNYKKPGAGMSWDSYQLTNLLTGWSFDSHCQLQYKELTLNWRSSCSSGQRWGLNVQSNIRNRMITRAVLRNSNYRLAPKNDAAVWKFSPCREPW